jgi:hypothetical protein
VALGRSLGHIGDSTVGLVTLVGLITIGLSTYLILYSHRVYEWVAPALSVFERARPTRDEEPPPPQEVDVILYGMGRYGANLATRLLESGHSVLAVDWDPHAALADPRHPRLRTVFGDADDPEYPGSLPLAHTRVVVSTIPDVATSSALVAALRRWGFDGPVALTAHTPDDAERLRALSADLVLEPFADAADDGARQLAALVRPGPGRHQPAPVAVPEQAPGGTGHDH